MQNLILGRRPYWLIVAALIVLKVGVVAVIMSAPQTFSSFLSYVDTAIIIVLALVVGARFVDIGWPRWLGVILVLVVGTIRLVGSNANKVFSSAASSIQ